MAERKSTVTSESEAALRGEVDRVVYSNDASGYVVARIHVPGERDPVTIVGTLMALAAGEQVELRGGWVQNKKFGRQFEVKECRTLMPASLQGIAKYLGSGLIKGIGPVMAQRMVAEFGDDTIGIIEKTPEKLARVEGIGKKRVGMIQDAWNRHRAVHDVMLFLQTHGVSPAYASKIYRTYGDASAAVVEQNPYRLAEDVFGIGFKTADRIAQRIGTELDAPERLAAGVLHVLGEMAGDGHVYVPRRELISAAAKLLKVDQQGVDDSITALDAAHRVHVEGNNVYLERLLEDEKLVAHRLLGLLRAPKSRVTIDVPRAVQWVEERQRIELADEQKEALVGVYSSKAIVVTGGPGTGKTALVRAIADIYAYKKQRVVLCAPTGRAAKRMEETTGRQAKTIHRLLEFTPAEMGFSRGPNNPFAADIVIVDETSMIDVSLMAALLAAVPVTATLVLIGDVDQLPSVGPGNVLRDIIESGIVPVVRLATVFRQEKESLIITNAHRINNGQWPAMPAQSPDADLADFYFIEKDDAGEAAQTIVELVSRRIPKRFGFDPLEDIQVISPMHKGAAGVTRLNETLRNAVNPGKSVPVRGSREFRVRDRVIQLRNNYNLDVYNGDIGHVVGINPIDQEMKIRFDQRTVKYDFEDTDLLAPAYAMSIHKSQGSEYPAVVMPLLTEHYTMLQRNLLYTAVTRASRLVVIVGSRRALTTAIRNNAVSKRYTALAQRLRAGWNG